MSYVYKVVQSPIGELTLVASAKGPAGILRENNYPARVRLTPRRRDDNDPIIGPCHRVIGSPGKLTGFAGGLAAKAYLLKLEARQGELLHD